MKKLIQVLLVIFVFFCLSNDLMAQKMTSYYSYYGILFSYSNPSEGFIEFGISKSKYSNYISDRKSINIIYNPFTDFKGISIDYQKGFIFCYGLNINSYFKKDQYNIGFMPKVGIGMPVVFTISYGYNFNFRNKNEFQLSNHYLTISYNLALMFTEKELALKQ